MNLSDFPLYDYQGLNWNFADTSDPELVDDTVYQN